jgi:hypothetical protein
MCTPALMLSYILLAIDSMIHLCMMFILFLRAKSCNAMTHVLFCMNMNFTGSGYSHDLTSESYVLLYMNKIWLLQVRTHVTVDIR